MKFLHVSDLHIGKRLNGMSMLDDQRHILSQIVSIACEREVDALLIAGDIYDKASPSAEAVTVFDSFLDALAQRAIRVLAIPGNHDSAERIAYAQKLLVRQGVCFPPVYEGNLESIELEDEYGPVLVWLVPYLRPADVRRYYPDADIADDYAAALTVAFDACEIDRTKRNVALAHQFVIGGEGAIERADEEIKLGGIDAVPVATFDRFDYVALGHVHRPQRVGRDSVRYAGSPLKYSFSEARYDKSVVYVEIGAKSDSDDVGDCVSCELVPLHPLHDVREVEATLDELLVGDRGDDFDAQDYLHVVLTDEQPRLDAMARIRDVFPNAMTLDYANTALLAAREASRTVVDPDGLDTVELFARFYQDQVDKELDEGQLSILTKVVAKVEEANAKGSDDGEESTL